MIRRFGLDPKRKKADKAGHFLECPWIVVETKSRTHIRKAVDQLAETLAQIDRRRFDVQYLAIVYDSLDKESRLYTVRRMKSKRRVLWIRAVGRSKPVRIQDIEVEAYTRKQVKDMYTRIDIYGTG